jgi:hypothetical protein
MRALVTFFLVAACAINTPAAPLREVCFDDEKLQNLAMRGGNDTGTLIYVWSPRMVLSVTQAASAAEAARALGMDVLALHDAHVSHSEIQQALQAIQRTSPQTSRALQGSEPLCSASLLKADALRHFPTAFVLTARGTHRFPIVGAMPPAAWRSSIAQRLKAS